MLKLIILRPTSLTLSHLLLRRYLSSLNTSGHKNKFNFNNSIASRFLKSQQQLPNHTTDPIRTRNTFISVSIFILGLTFLAIPLYELFCQRSGYLGTPKTHISYKNLTLPFSATRNKEFVVDFVSQSNIDWEFIPCQDSIRVKPGETALAFYKAKNLQPRPVIGIATYNVIPDEAGQYFNKIQCFCFEEQLLHSIEQVELPVYFYLDPEILKDPRLESVKRITLSYTFFESDTEIPEGYRLLNSK